MHMTVPHDPAADGSDAMEVTIERLRERIAELERALARFIEVAGELPENGDGTIQGREFHIAYRLACEALTGRPCATTPELHAACRRARRVLP